MSADEDAPPGKTLEGGQLVDNRDGRDVVLTLRGVRTQIGVKIFGPTGKNLTDAINDVQHVSEQIAARLKKVSGAVTRSCTTTGKGSCPSSGSW